MKTHVLLSLAALAALPMVGSAQYSTTVIGQVNTPGPYLLSADVKVNFVYTLTTAIANAGDIGNLVASLEVTNTTTLISPSQITGVYLLRPFVGGNMVMANPTPVTTDLDPNFPLVGTDTQWVAETSLDPNLAGYNGGTPVKANYFGVAINSPEGARLDNGDKGIFSFTFTGVVGDWTQSDFDQLWKGAGVPLFYIRWQGVGDRGQDSGKGWGGPGFDETVVPEPSAIAALAALGLGGLLLVRRRLIRQQK